jgi:hypothetical protein
MANLVIDRALNGYTPGGYYRWDRFLDATPPPLGTPVKNWTDFAHEDVRGAREESKPGKEPVQPDEIKSDDAGGNKVKNGTASLAQPVPNAETTPGARAIQPASRATARGRLSMTCTTSCRCTRSLPPTHRSCWRGSAKSAC